MGLLEFFNSLEIRLMRAVRVNETVKLPPIKEAHILNTYMLLDHLSHYILYSHVIHPFSHFLIQMTFFSIHVSEIKFLYQYYFF